MARSRPSGRRAASSRSAAPRSSSGGSGAGVAPAPSLASATLPRVWQGLGYRPLPDAAAARPLFEFAALPWPERAPLAFTWGAWAAGGGERLVGAVVAAGTDRDLILHGPVVRLGDAPPADGDAVPLEVAAQLVAAALDHAAARGAETVFTRPQGLDRVWIRFGFIPVPESTLPSGLDTQRGLGLYAWRGGSALWTLREAPREAG